MNSIKRNLELVNLVQSSAAQAPRVALEDANDEEEREPTTPLTCEDVIENINKHHERISGLDAKIGPGGIYVHPVLLAVHELKESFFAIAKIPDIQLQELAAGRNQVAQMLVDLKLLDLVAEVYQAHYRMRWEDEKGQQIPKIYGAVWNSATVMANYSDVNDDFAIALAGMPGLLPLLKEILVYSVQRHMDKTLKPKQQNQLELALTMIHNMTMRDDNNSLFRSYNFTEVLQPYLNSEDQHTIIVSLASLAGIIDEMEAGIILTRPETVRVLFRWLEKGLEDNHRRFNHWSCAEIAFTIGKLALNDVNKKQLVELGALELLVELGRTGNQQEQNKSIQAIWALTFDEDNRTTICSDSNLGVVELLIDLRSSNNPGIRKGCFGALWILRDSLNDSPEEKYRTIEKERRMKVKQRRRKKKADNTKGHIMLSYQWDDQEMMIRIRDRLKESGYQVWMDIDQIEGSTLQAMAEAVENAYIILISMTLKYKNSPNCRAEAEYAYQKQKKIIPLKLERGYIPDGWLGFIAGTKLYFEFSEKYPFDVKLSGLIKEIKGWEATQVNVPKPHEPADTIVPTASRFTTATVRQWTDTDVQNWIDKHDLKSCNLGSITGPEIALLLKMKIEAPDSFYKTLQEMLKLKSLLSLSKFVWALNDLQTETKGASSA